MCEGRRTRLRFPHRRRLLRRSGARVFERPVEGVVGDLLPAGLRGHEVRPLHLAGVVSVGVTGGPNPSNEPRFLGRGTPRPSQQVAVVCVESHDARGQERRCKDQLRHGRRRSAAHAAARLVLGSIVVDRAGVRRRTQERSPPRQRRPPRPRRERQAARSRRLHRGCPDRRRVRGRRRRRSGSVRDLGAVLRRMDRVDDCGRRPGAGSGDRGLGIVGSATRARRADGDRRVGRGPQARRDERAGRPVQDRGWERRSTASSHPGRRP